MNPKPNSSYQASIKLKCYNYLVWQSLFESIFRRYKLTKIIDGYESASPQFLDDSSGNFTLIPNPTFEAWYEKDQNIIIWINSTLSKDLIPFTVGV